MPLSAETVDGLRKLRFISLEGNIGAGKSWFSKFMSRILRENGLSVVVVEEPVREWQRLGLLDLFYEDPAHNGYKCQTMFFVLRIKAFLKALKEHPSADIFIIDRSWITDVLFMENLYNTVDEKTEKRYISDQEMAFYREWCETFYECSNASVSSVIFLDTSPKQCLDRIMRRDRCEESNMSLQYLTDLDTLHKAKLHGSTVNLPYQTVTVPVHHVDYDGIYNKDDKETGEFVVSVLNSIAK
jgi:deoxyadenosine/deoxycytidine kinase